MASRWPAVSRASPPRPCALLLWRRFRVPGPAALTKLARKFEPKRGYGCRRELPRLVKLPGTSSLLQLTLSKGFDASRRGLEIEQNRDAGTDVAFPIAPLPVANHCSEP